MIKKLSEFKAGERGIIKAVAGEGVIRRRLFDMGVTPRCRGHFKEESAPRRPLGSYDKGL